MTMMTVLLERHGFYPFYILLIEVTQGTAQWPALHPNWLIVLFISLIPSFMSQVFYMRGVDLIGPDRADVYSNLVPIYSAALGVLI